MDHVVHAEVSVRSPTTHPVAAGRGRRRCDRRRTRSAFGAPCLLSCCPACPVPRPREAGGETLLLTPDLDQASLHQLVARLRDLGIELLELRQATTPKRSRREAEKQ